MDLLLIALVLFLGMIACWVVLPSSPFEAAARHEMETSGQGAAQQLV